MSYRSREAEMDAMIEDHTLREVGVVEPDEPTEWSHYAYMREWHRQAEGEFTADERREIRAHLGLGPFRVPHSQPIAGDTSSARADRRASGGDET